jgi:lipopolysaccharide export LptBFGC system permease protein LptF
MLSSVNIISRYLAREFLLAATIVLATLVTLWVAADALLHIDDLASDLPKALREVVLRSLDVLPQGIPTACALGVVLCLSRAIRLREITALRCGGIRLRSAVAPLVGLGVVAGVLLGIAQDRVLVPAKVDLSGAVVPEDRERPRMVSDRWWYTANGWIFSAADFSGTDDSMRDVTVFRFDAEQRMRTRIDASRARYLGKGQWSLSSVVERTFTGEGRIELRQFDTLALRTEVDLASAVLRNAEGRPIPEAMTLHLLADAMQQAPTRSERQAMTAAYHARLATTASVPLLVLLMIPVGLSGNEKSDTLPRALLRALFALSAFWVIWTLGLLLAQWDSVPAPVPIWGTAAVALVAGCLAFRSIEE